jgi:phosphate transport system protein
VAGDLRLIVAILRVVNDLERVGDLAYNIAKLVQLEDFCEPGPKAIHTLVADLGNAAAQLIGKSIDAWATKDEALAADLARQDDRIDDLHAQLITRLLELNDQASVGPAIRLAMVGRYFERIGDHAVNLGERVRYFVTGDEEHLG